MKKIIIIVSVIFVILICIAIGLISSVIKSYLNQFNYNDISVGKVMLIYLHINKEYTIEENEDSNKFIGVSDYEYYVKKFAKKGYTKVEQAGNLIVFENDKKEQLTLLRSHDRCHWFTIYYFSDKIENYV